MELVTISSRQIGDAVEQTVNARELHTALGVRKDFSNWIKPKLNEEFFKEGRDFITVAQKGEGGKFGKIEYILTLDTAKHIAMLSKTPNAYKIREYFIEVEKRYRNQQTENMDSVKEFVVSAFTPMFEMMSRSLETMSKSIEAMANTQSQIMQQLESGGRTDREYRVTEEVVTRKRLVQFDDVPSNQEAEDLFIGAVQNVLRNAKGAINQTQLLATLGVRRDNKTARRRLDKYDGTYWVSKYYRGEKLYKIL